MNNFYVYAYVREDGTPYYIGKGKERRAWEQHRVNGKGVHTPKDYKRIVLLREELSEEDAFHLETELIAKHGRKDLGTGILENRTNGGEGSTGTSPETNWKKGSSRRGKTTSIETRRKISEANQRREYPNGHTDEVRQKIREATKKLWKKRSRTITEEQRKKISDGMKEKWRLRKQNPLG
jgi:hypothetical protein